MTLCAKISYLNVFPKIYLTQGIQSQHYYIMYFQIWKDSNKVKASQGRGLARDCGFELISIPKATV